MSKAWHKAWQEGKIGFHASAVHSDLLKHSHFLDAGPHRVLVPLCGKSVDLIWLSEQGHEVVGVELVPMAVEQFFSDNDLQASVEEKGSLRIHRSGGITIICGSIFDVDAESIGTITRVWDRAALVALPADLRARYIAHLRGIVAPQATFLLNVFRYDTQSMDGPPHSIPDSEVLEHFSGCEIKLLSEEDTLDQYPPFKAKGLTYLHSCTYDVGLPAR